MEETAASRRCDAWRGTMKRRVRIQIGHTVITWGYLPALFFLLRCEGEGRLAG